MKEGSGPRAVLADTNVFLALLAGPAHALHEDALGLFRRVAEGQLVLTVTPVVVAELVYAAEPVLGWDRKAAAMRLGKLLLADGLSVREEQVIVQALELYGRLEKMDFPDAYLAASALTTGAAVASFDRDYDAIAGLERIAA
jgi:predicted nucleic acid-binding protein